MYLYTRHCWENELEHCLKIHYVTRSLAEAFMPRVYACFSLGWNMVKQFVEGGSADDHVSKWIVAGQIAWKITPLWSLAHSCFRGFEAFEENVPWLLMQCSFLQRRRAPSPRAKSLWRNITKASYAKNCLWVPCSLVQLQVLEMETIYSDLRKGF